jgi:hypothetical protein
MDDFRWRMDRLLPVAYAQLVHLMMSLEPEILFDLKLRKKRHAVAAERASRKLIVWLATTCGYGIAAMALYSLLPVESKAIEVVLFLVGFGLFSNVYIHYCRAELHANHHDGLDRVRSSLELFRTVLQSRESFILILRDFGTISDRKPYNAESIGVNAMTADPLIESLTETFGHVCRLVTIHNDREDLYKTKNIIQLPAPSRGWEALVESLTKAAALVVVALRDSSPGLVVEAEIFMKSDGLLDKTLVLHPRDSEGEQAGAKELIRVARWSAQLARRETGVYRFLDREQRWGADYYYTFAEMPRELELLTAPHHTHASL